MRLRLLHELLADCWRLTNRLLWLLWLYKVGSLVILLILHGIMIHSVLYLRIRRLLYITCWCCVICSNMLLGILIWRRKCSRTLLLILMLLLIYHRLMEIWRRRLHRSIVRIIIHICCNSISCIRISGYRWGRKT